MENPAANVVQSTPIDILNPATITLGILSLLIVPAILFKPGNWIQWFERKKYQYEVTFSLYMLTPTEKFIFNSILFLFISITFIAASLYLPDHLATIARRVYYYISGTPP